MENKSAVTPSNLSSSSSLRPVAPRTKMILEAPVVSTLIRLSVPNVLNLLAFVGLITFDGLFLGKLGADALAGVSLDSAVALAARVTLARTKRRGRTRD